MLEVDTKKPYNEMSTDELGAEYIYLSDLYKDCISLGLGQPRQTIAAHLVKVSAALEDRNMIH
jgi:hypothetical protein